MKNEKKELKYMKKLNNKGFTLVELLAVIVILAVIMVITIPTVLGSMSDATDKAFDSAKKAVQKYIDDQIELCNAGLGDLAGYESSLFVKQGKTCRPSYDAADTNSDGSVSTTEKTAFLEKIVEKAGYKGQMTIEIDTESVCVSGNKKVDGSLYATADQCDYDGITAASGDPEDGHKETGYKTAIKTATGQGEFAGK